MIEMHRRPSEALCGGKQTVDVEESTNLMLSLRSLASLIGRTAYGEADGGRL
jgi:3-deoxy-D-arabino-heptulosonate 7-phosphate (DAHP) synthase